MERALPPVISEAQQVLSEAEQLLSQAEQLHQAIASGEVDAFLVGKDDKEKRVMLLAGAYQRYRQLVEMMQQGAVTCSVHADILYANQRFAHLIGVPVSQLYAAPLDGYVSVPDRARLASFLMVSARLSSIEISFTRRDGLLLPARLDLVNFADSYATLLVTPLHQNLWAAGAEESLALMRTALETLNRSAPGGETRLALDVITREINSLGRLLEEQR